MAKNWTTTNTLELNPCDIVDESYLTKVICKGDIRAEQYNFHLHPTSYGKEYFLVYMGKLRQFKVIRTYLCPWNWRCKNNHKSMIAIHELEICGMGRILVAHNDGSGTNFVCKVYKTPEDYKNGNEGYLGYTADNFEEINPFNFDFVREPSFMCSGYDYVPKVWQWNGTRAVSEKVNKVPMFYSFDGENYHVPNAENFEVKEGYYLSKEECEDENAIEVEYFAKNDKEEKEKAEIEITIASVTLKVKESDAEKIISYIKGLDS